MRTKKGNISSLRLTHCQRTMPCRPRCPCALSYDHTLRDVDGTVIQFPYGDDGSIKYQRWRSTI
ncbi:unnamed protein product [Spirodela intermedia]|uniref:Uncharacterized protein n=1 Tax=Spirodela intermedia TaxID=51605 RepID=A0A7I8L2S4_SPIIN|nr:unnamed protein product [Spirodela intermedia]